MTAKLKDITVRMVALVDKGANQDAHITLVKRDNTNTTGDGAQKVDLQMTDADKAALEADIATAKSALAEKEREIAELKGVAAVPGALDTVRKEYSAVSDELATVRRDLQKQLEDKAAELEATKAEITKLHAANRREDFIKFCHQNLADLPGATADDTAEMFDKFEKAVGAKDWAKFAGRLRSWSTIVAKSKVFEEIGRSGTAPAWGSAEGALHALATERATQKNIPFVKAYDEVLVENPDLYKRYRAEKES